MKNIIKLNFLSLLNVLQTWDLTRLMVYGFTEFADDFFGRYPNYYIWPRRINGSALETIFGQLKFSMGGHLSAVNYPAALASLKIKKTATWQKREVSLQECSPLSEAGKTAKKETCQMSKIAWQQVDLFYNITNEDSVLLSFRNVLRSFISIGLFCLVVAPSPSLPKKNLNSLVIA